jgi:hypothetical protein
VSAADRAECKALIAEAVRGGARREKAAELLGVSVRTMERWQTRPQDGRKGPNRKPSNALTPEERARVLAVANSSEFASLTPWQIVPRLADRGEYLPVMVVHSFSNSFGAATLAPMEMFEKALNSWF